MTGSDPLKHLLASLTRLVEERKTSTSGAMLREISAKIEAIQEIVGIDVVDRVEQLVAIGRDVIVSVFDGRGCSQNGGRISTCSCQLIVLKGAAPCERCSEILIDGRGLITADLQLVVGVYAG